MLDKVLLSMLCFLTTPTLYLTAFIFGLNGNCNPRVQFPCCNVLVYVCSIKKMKLVDCRGKSYASCIIESLPLFSASTESLGEFDTQRPKKFPTLPNQPTDAVYITKATKP